MPAEALDANAAQRRYWNTVRGPALGCQPGVQGAATTRKAPHYC